MYNNEKEITQYVMNALEEGININEIKQEVFRLAHEEIILRPAIENYNSHHSESGFYEIS